MSFIKEDNQPFARNLAFALQRKGLKPEDISKKSGIGQSTVYKILKGGDCSYRTMRKISEVLEITLSELVADKQSTEDDINKYVKINNRLQNLLINYSQAPLNIQDKVCSVLEFHLRIEIEYLAIESNQNMFLNPIIK